MCFVLSGNVLVKWGRQWCHFDTTVLKGGGCSVSSALWLLPTQIPGVILQSCQLSLNDLFFFPVNFFFFFACCAEFCLDESGRGCCSVGRASDWHATDAGFILWCSKRFFSQSQRSVQTLLQSPNTPLCSRMR